MTAEGIDFLSSLNLSSPNVRYVLLGMILLGITGGILGSFTLLRKRTLIGDVLAHATLPGIGLAFIITGSREPSAILPGAFLASVLGVLTLIFIRKNSRIKEDAVMAIVLTVFFGIGVVLLTIIQKSGAGNQAGLDKFLFGQSAAMVGKDVALIGAMAVILIALTLAFHKELTLLCFDAGFTESLGFSSLLLDILLMTLTVGVVVIGLQAVGVVLMAAMLIIPPVTARLWTDRLPVMIPVAAAVGAVSGAGGSIISVTAPRLPSGPLTILAATSVFVLSLLLAPRKGLITQAWRSAAARRRTMIDNTLRALAEAAELCGSEISKPLTAEDIRKLRYWDTPEISRRARLLSHKGLIQYSGADFVLTTEGSEQARSLLRRHRLWEWYLMNQADIPADHVHRDADESEHFLTPEMEATLTGLMASSMVDLQSPHPVGRREENHV